MMALDICNVSADQGIKAATAALGPLSLSSYTGKSIEESAIMEAQCLICIVMDSYALPYTTGSDLISKVTNIQCAYFNHTMYNYLDEICNMEDKVGASCDPLTLTLDPDYVKLG